VLDLWGLDVRRLGRPLARLDAAPSVVQPLRQRAQRCVRSSRARAGAGFAKEAEAAAPYARSTEGLLEALVQRVDGLERAVDELRAAAARGKR
jgi:hypothetical protein